MKLFKNWELAFALFILTLPFHVYCQNSWEIDKDKDGIKVFTKTVEGSNFKSFKAVIKLSASMDEILKVLKNGDGFSEWYGFVKVSKQLKQDNNIHYNYVETIFPWPYSNRDMVYQMSFDSLSSQEFKVSINGIPGYIPENKGKVRMKKAGGYILLKPIGQLIEVTYMFHSEPGDNVPAWLANNAIAELPFQTLTGLREVLKDNSL